MLFFDKYRNFYLKAKISSPSMDSMEAVWPLANRSKLNTHLGAITRFNANIIVQSPTCKLQEEFQFHKEPRQGRRVKIVFPIKSHWLWCSSDILDKQSYKTYFRCLVDSIVFSILKLLTACTTLNNIQFQICDTSVLSVEIITKWTWPDLTII